MTINVRKLLVWPEQASPVLEAEIVAAGLNHSLDRALMGSLVEINLPEATVSITARGLTQLQPVMPAD
jgi:hypothetical protein